MIPWIVVYHFTRSDLFGFLAFFFGLFVFTVPIDRWLDDNWRKSAEI